MNPNLYYPAHYSTNGPELDPNAVDELFENVVYGDGIGVYDGAQQRRLEAEQRRLEAEQRRLEVERRARENAEKRARAEKDHQFFDCLVLSGPDRPALKPDQPPHPAHTPAPRSTKIQIPFTAADRSRIPRKTRQQWLDKFQAACEVSFPGVLTTLDTTSILSLEQSVYQTTKTSTAYVGAWMNKIHAMKSAPSLEAFISPESLNKTSCTQASQQAAADVQLSETAPSMSSSTSLERTTVLSSDRQDGVETVDLLPSISTSLSTNPGKASLLGKELPFSLFGSDDEDDDTTAAAAAAKSFSPAGPSKDECINEVLSSSKICAGSSSAEIDQDVEHQVDLDNTGIDAAPAPTDILPPTDASNPSTSDDSCQKVEQNVSSASCEESLPNGQTNSNKTEMAGDICNQTPVESSKDAEAGDRQKSDRKHGLKKRKPTDRAAGQPLSKKNPAQFDPECKTFLRDVVAAHLRLRFGRELSGKDVVSVQSRIVEKILSDPKWTLERLRKHKRNIDDLAEHYANRMRRERKSSRADREQPPSDN